MLAKPTQISDLALLVVDDEEVMRELVKGVATRYGVGTVFTAADGREALAILGKRPVHGLFCDIEMGQMNGLELLAQVRRGEVPREAGVLHTIPPWLPVIMLTGHATAAIVEKAVRTGADGYVTKPVKVPAIQKGVDRILDKWGQDFTVGLRYARMRRPEYARFVLQGQITPRSQPVVRNLLKEIEEEERPHIALDLSAVGFVDEFGFGTLLMANGIAALKGRRMAIIAENDQIKRDLLGVRIGQVIPIFESQIAYARHILGLAPADGAAAPARTG